MLPWTPTWEMAAVPSSVTALGASFSRSRRRWARTVMLSLLPGTLPLWVGGAWSAVLAGMPLGAPWAGTWAWATEPEAARTRAVAPRSACLRVTRLVVRKAGTPGERSAPSVLRES